MKIINDAIDKFTPKPKPHRHKSNQWWSKELNDMRKEHNRLRRLYQRNRNNTQIKNEYKRQEHLYKNKIKHEKWKNFQEYCSNCTSPYDFVKDIKRNNDNYSVPPLKKDDGSMTEYGHDTADYILNKLFPDDITALDSREHKEKRDKTNI